MRTCRFLVLLLVVGLVLASPLAAQPPSQRAPERGKALYESYCAVCHGVDGRADTPVSSHLEPRPRNFADPVEMARVTDDRIYRAIKEGRPGTAMAAWGQVLSETQIGDVIEHIRSLAPPRAPALSAEQLSLEVGRRIYEKGCVVCHGPDGRGDTAVAKVLHPRPRSFADPVEMARLDDGRLYAAIKLGRPGTAMGGWGELLSPEIIDVMRYVRSLVRQPPQGMRRTGLDVLVGERIYREHCIGCHGEKGDGRTPLGRTLVPRGTSRTPRRWRASATRPWLTRSPTADRAPPWPLGAVSSTRRTSGGSSSSSARPSRAPPSGHGPPMGPPAGTRARGGCRGS